MWKIEIRQRTSQNRLKLKNSAWLIVSRQAFGIDMKCLEYFFGAMIGIVSVVGIVFLYLQAVYLDKYYKKKKEDDTTQ